MLSNEKYEIIINKTDYGICVFAIINDRICSADISKMGFDNTKNIYYFNRLIVPQPLRGKGVATLLMKKLIEILDIEKIILICEVNPYGDLNEEQLFKFYKKYGFVDDESFKSLIRFPIS